MLSIIFLSFWGWTHLRPEKMWRAMLKSGTGTYVGGDGRQFSLLGEFSLSDSGKWRWLHWWAIEHLPSNSNIEGTHCFKFRNAHPSQYFIVDIVVCRFDRRFTALMIGMKCCFTNIKYGLQTPQITFILVLGLVRSVLNFMTKKKGLLKPVLNEYMLCWCNNIMSGHGLFNKCGLLPDAAPTVLCLVSYWAPPMAPSVNKRLAVLLPSLKLSPSCSLYVILELLHT